MSVIEAPTWPAPATREVTEADVLERAADLLEEFGWCQRNFASDPSGNLVYPSEIRSGARGVSYCVRGAIFQAAVDFGRDGYEAMGPYRAWESWNDTLGRTKAEVVAKLRDAAARARA